MAWKEIHLPIGVSFFTFQAISYLFDVYRGDVKAEKDPLVFTVYLSLFPQLIAGPIVRFRDVAKDLRERVHTLEGCSLGARQFIRGLAKKVILADSLAYIVDIIFQAVPGHVTPALAWMGIFSFSFQIYFDFSGYSDMAIGLGRIFGFSFPENFNRPFMAKSLREFWRRWHMTLTSWFRDYVYIPMGGNRKGVISTAFNLVIVFLLTGFWHGASWMFMAWGLFHGLVLSLERFSLGSFLKKIPAWCGQGYVFIFVSLSWILFRCRDLSHAGDYFWTLFGFGGWSVRPYQFWAAVEPFHLAIFSVAGLLSFFKIPETTRLFEGETTLRRAISNSAHVFLFLLTSCFVSAVSHRGFIYFRF